MAETKKIDYFTDTAEPCADVIGQASVIEEAERQRGVKAAALACAPQRHHRFDGTHCVEDDCGVVIPAPRLAQGKVRCVDCQAALEVDNKRFRRG